MEEIIYYNNLYDYYKKLLTKIQQNYFEDYYFNNLSLQEIADNYKVTKSAVSKTLIEVTNKLSYYEENLNLYKNYKEIKKELNQEDLNKIEDYI